MNIGRIGHSLDIFIFPDHFGANVLFVISMFWNLQVLRQYDGHWIIYDLKNVVFSWTMTNETATSMYHKTEDSVHLFKSLDLID